MLGSLVLRYGKVFLACELVVPAHVLEAVFGSSLWRCNKTIGIIKDSVGFMKEGWETGQGLVVESDGRINAQGII